MNITNNSAGPTISIRGLYCPPTETARGHRGPLLSTSMAAFSRKATCRSMLYDLERVEVVKGPQSTLFGKDAEAGAINFISNKPVLGEFSSGADLEFGSYDTVRRRWRSESAGRRHTRLAESLPNSYSHEGYMHSGLDDADTHGGRVSLLWKPSEAESFSLVGDYALDNSRDDAGTVLQHHRRAARRQEHLHTAESARDDTFYNGDSNGPSSVFYRHSV